MCMYDPMPGMLLFGLCLNYEVMIRSKACKQNNMDELSILYQKTKKKKMETRAKLYFVVM